jgi:hypothetical protein
MTQTITKTEIDREVPRTSVLARAFAKRVCDRTGVSVEQAKSIYRRAITRGSDRRQPKGSLIAV